jgi:GntP family gluconate:H+ symporter
VPVVHPTLALVNAARAAGGRETGSTGTGSDDVDDVDLGQAAETDAGEARPRRQPALGATILTVLLPVLLMLVKAVCDLTLDKSNGLRSTFDVLGNPPVALLIGLIVAMFTLGTAVGFGRERISQTVGGALPGIAGILLIVAAGGGFKQVLVDSGISGLIAEAAKGASLSPLVLGWLVAVGIRLATGSATVATVTAAGIVVPLAAGLDRPTVALLVLAIGAGSLFFSHVNDAGFWLVKEYFGMSVGQTIRTWSLMETVLSVTGLLSVLVLSIFIS